MRADTYSKSKYASVISQAGGWAWFQELLSALRGVADRHGSDIATVASKWVLDQPQASHSFITSHTALDLLLGFKEGSQARYTSAGMQGLRRHASMWCTTGHRAAYLAMGSTGAVIRAAA